MDGEADWIKAALKRDRSKTQNGLAAALGIDKSSVSRLLRGERRLKFSEAQIAAEYLGVDARSGFAEEGEEFNHGERANASGRDRAPLYRASAVKDGYWRLDRDIVVERKPCGPLLSGVVSAFGLYAPDDAMAPRFKTGEVAWINPARPAAPGEDALMISNTPSGETAKVLLCELLAVENGRYRVRQHGRPEDRCLDAKSWKALYVFPRS